MCRRCVCLNLRSTLTTTKCGIIRNMAKQNKEYGYDIQKVYPEMMLADAETFVRCPTIFDPKAHTI